MSPEQVLRIEILRGWWNTPWFRILCIAVVLLLVAAIYIYRKHLRRKRANRRIAQVAGGSCSGEQNPAKRTGIAKLRAPEVA